MQELTVDYANQLRPSRTEYDSATNPNICQFVSIRGIRGLCGIGVYGTSKFRVKTSVLPFCPIVKPIGTFAKRADPDQTALFIRAT